MSIRLRILSSDSTNLAGEIKTGPTKAAKIITGINEKKRIKVNLRDLMPLKEISSF
jgi:hypothetical protein|tara:strand:- start:1094 stop:1261 length:168 start_codon:yes stop_codon:yes gene_type:complete